MNRHFKDSQYYLRRAAATTKAGIAEEVAPVRGRVSRLRGGEEEAAEETGRLATVRSRVSAGARRARAEIEDAVSRGRERVRTIRS